MIQLTPNISYIAPSSSPLSANVIIIRGTSKTWLFDVGSSDHACHVIQQIPGEKTAILSHFHPDHIKNVSSLDPIRDHINYYVSSNTYKYVNCGTVVTSDLYIDDGVLLHIFPLPSSHAKGCLGLEVDQTYAFLGDATYSTRKHGKAAYNAGVLKEELHVLKNLSANYFLPSHSEPFLQEKKAVLTQLEQIYSMRKNGEPYIFCESFQ